MISVLQNILIRWLTEFSHCNLSIVKTSTACENPVSYMQGTPPDPVSITVFPNPVKSGGSIDLVCNKLTPGYYQIQLFNKFNSEVMNMRSWIDGDEQIINISLPPLYTGLYKLVVSREEVRHEEDLVVS